MRNIVIDELKRTPIDEQRVEIVERKGLGHPDFICDAIMNDVSVNLCKEYLKQFGAIMHHNIDKGLLVAGEVEHRWGGGVVKVPMLLVFGDRATFRVEDKKILVEQIAISTAKEWIRKNLRFVDPVKHIRYQVELKEVGAALGDIFKRRGKILGANDTSALVGYAPMTPTEKIVLKTEKFLNSKEFKRSFPETGEDVKVMGLRRDEELDLTIAMAFVDRFIQSEEDYFRKKEEVLEEIRKFVKEGEGFRRVNVALNTLDRKGRGIRGVYLTVFGTSADGSDCGQVGRGNRVTGVIPLNRPISSEAAAGKNPVSHVGKIYNALTHHIANQIYEKVPGIREVYVWLLSQIGIPIDQPTIAVAQVVMSEGNSLKEIEPSIREVMDSELENIQDFCMRLARGEFPIF
jgi:S-adenosylmethionine synthetase